VLLVAVAGCASRPTEPLLEQLDAVGPAPEGWELVGTEVDDDCSVVSGQRCPSVTRTWRTDQPEAEVRDQLEALFPNARVDTSTNRCDQDTSDCYATLQLETDDFAASIQAVEFEGATEATAEVFYD
jgi:hypothetical protein